MASISIMKVYFVLGIIFFATSSVCSGAVILSVSPYPAPVYEGAPADVPVLTVQGYDNFTGIPVTSFRLESRNDASYFKIDPSGVLRTSTTMSFQVGKIFEFFVFGQVNNQTCPEDKVPCDDADDTEDYKHVKIEVTAKNRFAPYFEKQSYSFSVYRYGVGDRIGKVVARDDDEEPYNRQVTFVGDQTSPSAQFVQVNTNGVLQLALPVPDQLSVLTMTVLALDKGSPQMTATATVTIDVLLVRQPNIFCFSTTRTTITLCWKNPMPGMTFDGYNITVRGTQDRVDFLPNIGEIEACYTLNGTRFGSQYVFAVTVVSPNEWHGEELRLMFNKTAVGYARECITNRFSVCSYRNPCNNHGMCLPDSDPLKHTCVCNIGWKGENCTLQDICAYSPCENGGRCQYLGHAEYECDCPSGYFGENCEHYNICLDNPCQGQSSCHTYDNGTYECNCPPGISGQNCEIIDPCSPSPCLTGHGDCKRLSDTDFQCVCYLGYHGDRCQEANACELTDKPCQYRGTCITSEDTYYCICPPGTTGRYCEQLDPCIIEPCMNHGKCSIGTTGSYVCECLPGYSGNECQDEDYCHGVDCQNGTCVVETGSSTRCECSLGYYGDNCEKFDTCGLSPCHNHGTCTSYGDVDTYKSEFICDCFAGWYGTDCNSIDDCTVDVCRNGGTCENNPAGGHQCRCPPGFYLNDCSAYDTCYQHDCQHGAGCRNISQTDYECDCSQDWVGKLCDIESPCSQRQNPCLNGGICQVIDLGSSSISQTAESSSFQSSRYTAQCDCPEGTGEPNCHSVCEGQSCQPSCQEIQTDELTCTCVNGEQQCTENAMRTLNDLLGNTSDPSKLTADQVSEYAKKLLGLYNESLEDVNITKSALNVLGNLGRVNISVSEKAENESQTNTKLREFLQNYTSDVQLTEKDWKISVSAAEVQVQAVSLEEALKQNNGMVSVQFEPYLTDNGTVEQLNMTIELPYTILNETKNESPDTRIQFIGFKRSQLFVPSRGFMTNSMTDQQRVISATVKGKQLVNLSEPVVIRLPLIKSDANHTCVFWDPENREWSKKGVITRPVEGDTGIVTCESNHLTSFAVLLDVDPGSGASSAHEEALTYITYIGCAISLASLLITIVTYGLFRCLNNEKSGKILLNLCSALVLLNITFLVATVDVSDFSEGGCLAAAILLHYFLLAALMWMLVEAVEMYQALVTVFTKYERLYLLKRLLIAWGIPAVIVSITAAVDVHSYNDSKKTRMICFLTSDNPAAYYSALIAPASVILVINTVVFIVVARVILRPKFQQQINNDTATVTPAQIRGAFTVMFLMGITWVFGPLAINEARLFFSYLFCICNSLQGFLIFVFRCLFNPEAKLAWMQLIQTGTLKRRRGPIKSIYSDSTSKGGDHRRPSNSNSGYNGTTTTSTRSSIGKNANVFHPHPHQLHNTNGWHPNLNGLRREKGSNGSDAIRGLHEYQPFNGNNGRRQSSNSEHAGSVKRHSPPTSSSMRDYQDDMTHF